MGVKQSVGRSCDFFQDTKTAEKTHFLKLVFCRFFQPISFYEFSQIWLFALKSGFIRKLGTFLEGRWILVGKFYFYIYICPIQFAFEISVHL